MKKRNSILALLVVTALIMAMVMGCSSNDAGDGGAAKSDAEKPVLESGLPEQMAWSTFGVGSSTYVQSAGIADALTTKFGTKVRILPSDTSVGRIQGIVNDEVDYTITADGAYFASYGLYDFATPDLGPKKIIRTLLARPGSATAVTTKKSGITTPSDFKGKRLAWIPGATSVNIKAVACLAFADLTLDDITLVTAPSYKASVDLLKNGEADWMIGQVTASYWHEFESMGLGVKFIEFPATDTAGWERFQKVTPWIYPDKEEKGVGFDTPIEIPHYVNPLFVTTSNKSVDEVYSLTKAIDETYDMYKDIDPLMPGWRIDLASNVPVQCPYHEGAIKYFKEKGLWTEEHEKWNNDYIAELDKVSKAWETFKEKAVADKMPENEMHDAWIVVLEETLGRKFPANYDK